MSKTAKVDVRVAAVALKAAASAVSKTAKVDVRVAAVALKAAASAVSKTAKVDVRVAAVALKGCCCSEGCCGSRCMFIPPVNPGTLAPLPSETLPATLCTGTDVPVDAAPCPVCTGC